MKRFTSTLLALATSFALLMGVSLAPANAATAPAKSIVKVAKIKSTNATKHGVPLEKNGRVKFSQKVGVKISTKKALATAKKTAKKYHTSVGFEQDIMGCEVAYPAKKSRATDLKYSDCVNVTIRFHKMYI